MKIEPARIAAVLLALAGTTACRTTATETGPPSAQPAPPSGPVIVQPGAPGAPSRIITADEATDLSRVQHTAADVEFMQGMIGHHGQAIDMTALVPTRTDNESLHLLAQRITLSQDSEIKLMQTWLTNRGEEAPGAQDHHEHGMLMPGMLTPEEMSRLASLSGAAFDRFFLESMFKHHAGALTMVEELLANPGAGQETIIANFAADVVADQSAEMDRMSAMLNAMLQE